jgi:hypothetical protein
MGANRIDLGDDHWLAYTDYQGERAGASQGHKRADGTECVGFIAFEGRAWARSFGPGAIATWKVEQEEPLTLSPSLLCRSCGDHGFIRDGKWVRA